MWKKEKCFKHAMERTGLGMTVWNSTNIDGLNLRVNKLVTKLDETIKTVGRTSSMWLKQTATIIENIHVMPII